jgi:hypothetical protein
MVMTDCPVVVGYRIQVINKQKVNLSQKRIQRRRETAEDLAQNAKQGRFF